MTYSHAMCYAWLYLSKGVEVLPQLVHALSIPRSNVLAGEDTEAVVIDMDDLGESGLQHFSLKGDFAICCDIRLAGWTLPAVKVVLQQLSASGARIAMIDDSSDNPFACILFDSGSCRPVTVVKDDETDEVTLYSGC
jgi:hypothetical protein